MILVFSPPATLSPPVTPYHSDAVILRVCDINVPFLINGYILRLPKFGDIPCPILIAIIASASQSVHETLRVVRQVFSHAFVKSTRQDARVAKRGSEMKVRHGG